MPRGTLLFYLLATVLVAVAILLPDPPDEP
jgi:hypothetical protein